MTELAAPTGVRWALAPYAGSGQPLGAEPPLNVLLDDSRLSPDDLQRLATLTHPDRRAAFVAGRGLARWLVDEKEPVEVTVAPGGCPLLPGRDLRLGIAHSAGWVTAAVGSPRWLGVDLEAHRPIHPGLVRRIRRDDERAPLDRASLTADGSVLLLWTLKEAVLKALGLGLRVSPTAVRLTQLDPTNRTARLDLPGLDTSGEPFRAAYLALPERTLALAWR